MQYIFLYNVFVEFNKKKNCVFSMWGKENQMNLSDTCSSALYDARKNKFYKTITRRRLVTGCGGFITKKKCTCFCFINFFYDESFLL